MATVEDHVSVCSRWVLCNKGDANNPDFLARLVACAINSGNRRDQFFPPTPPLGAKRTMFARYAQERTRHGQPLQLSCIDIRKAHFSGPPDPPFFIAFPKKTGLPSNCVARLRKRACGTRDAGADAYRLALEGMGFIAGCGVSTLPLPSPNAALRACARRRLHRPRTPRRFQLVPSGVGGEL